MLSLGSVDPGAAAATLLLSRLAEQQQDREQLAEQSSVSASEIGCSVVDL